MSLSAAQIFGTLNRKLQRVRSGRNPSGRKLFPGSGSDFPESGKPESGFRRVVPAEAILPLHSGVLMGDVNVAAIGTSKFTMTAKEEKRSLCRLMTSAPGWTSGAPR